MKCPICKQEYAAGDRECSLCGFTELHIEFVNVEEARVWERTVLRPCRAIWEKAKHNQFPEKTTHDDSKLMSNGVITYPRVVTCNNYGAPCEIFDVQCEKLPSGSTRVRFSAKLLTDKGSSINVTCRIKTKTGIVLGSEHWSNSTVTSNDVVRGVCLFENIPADSYLDFV